MAPHKHDFGISDQGELWGNPLGSSLRNKRPGLLAGHVGGPDNAQIPSRIDAEVAEPEIAYFMNCPYFGAFGKLSEEAFIEVMGTKLPMTVTTSCVRRRDDMASTK